jgi:hypothetical protein
MVEWRCVGSIRYRVRVHGWYDYEVLIGGPDSNSKGNLEKYRLPLLFMILITGCVPYEATPKYGGVVLISWGRDLFPCSS